MAVTRSPRGCSTPIMTDAVSFSARCSYRQAGAKRTGSSLPNRSGLYSIRDRLKAYLGTTSLPFFPGESSRTAVKIIGDHDIENLKLEAHRAGLRVWAW